jgi:capsular exopolysaccharide synthesis family protein
MTDKPTIQESPEQGDFERVLRVLRRHAGLIVLCTLLTAAAAFGFSKQQTKQYTATASLVFEDSNQIPQILFGQSGGPEDTPARQSTRVKLLELGPAATRTAKKLGDRVDVAEVKDSVSISPQGESNVVDVAATTTSPELSARIANTYAKQFIAAQARSSQRSTAQARKLIERQYSALSGEERTEPQGLALLSQIQSLTVASKLSSGEAQLAHAASAPTSPSSPKVARNAILGGLLGLLLGLGLAFLFERLNRQLRDPEEAREAFGLPVLGTVPESKAIMASNEGSAAAELPFVENEAFRMLRASLRYFNVDEDLRTVLVTSYRAGAGKTTIAWNLARVGASGSRAIVVETDLRNPTLARQHGLEPGPGLAEVLTRQVGLDAAIQFKRVATSAGPNGAEEPTLHAITAGALPPNPAELLESRAMDELLSQLEERYELIVIDTAPIGVISDCFPLLRRVDGVVAVARMGKSTRESAGKVREQLERLDAPTLGVVANGLRLGRRGQGRYGYRYYGDYYGEPAERAGAQTAQPPPASSPQRT